MCVCVYECVAVPSFFFSFVVAPGPLLLLLLSSFVSFGSSATPAHPGGNFCLFFSFHAHEIQNISAKHNRVQLAVAAFFFIYV